MTCTSLNYPIRRENRAALGNSSRSFLHVLLLQTAIYPIHTCSAIGVLGRSDYFLSCRVSFLKLSTATSQTLTAATSPAISAFDSEMIGSVKVLTVILGGSFNPAISLARLFIMDWWRYGPPEDQKDVLLSMESVNTLLPAAFAWRYVTTIQK